MVSPTSFLRFMQSSETLHSVDAGTFVTYLVHGHSAESQCVGFRRENIAAAG